jgi:hypothetical protein
MRNAIFFRRGYVGGAGGLRWCSFCRKVATPSYLAVQIYELYFDFESKSPAYISGDAAMALAEVVCELGCDHCREVK